MDVLVIGSHKRHAHALYLYKKIGKSRLQCTRCVSMFLTQQGLDDHEESHRKKDAKKTGLKCQTCGAVLCNIYTLRRHKWLKHSKSS
jgi:hypothetical protein